MFFEWRPQLNVYEELFAYAPVPRKPFGYVFGPASPPGRPRCSRLVVSELKNQRGFADSVRNVLLHAVAPKDGVMASHNPNIREVVPPAVRVGQYKRLNAIAS